MVPGTFFLYGEKRCLAPFWGTILTFDIDMALCYFRSMGLQAKQSTLWPFFVFHLRVGIRIALRKVAAIVALIFAVFMILRADFFAAVFAGLLQDKSLFTGLVFAAVAIGIALMASPRICLGLTGWVRHLPASGPTHRRLATLAVFVAQLPILIFLALLAIFVSQTADVSVLLFLAGLTLLGLAAAQCVLPVKRRFITIPLAAMNCVIATSGQWYFLVDSFVLLLIVDLISGPIVPIRKPPTFRQTFSGFFLTAIIAWRALRIRILIPYLLSLLVLGLTRIFVQNNSFSLPLNFRAMCFGGALSIFLFCAFIAGRLSERRPVWPWVRSLPWTARERVLIDANFLAILSVPQLVLTSLLDVRALWPVACSLPLVVTLASLIMRRGFRYRLGAGEMITYVGIAGAVTLSVFPWISLLYLALTPLAVKYAIDEERAQKVSLWHEMHHLAAGDPLSWSKQ